MSSTSRLFPRRARRGAALALSLSALLAPARPAASEGQNKIVYDKFDWLVYKSTHFEVYYYTREKGSLQKVVSMAESAYDELSRRLNFQIPKPIPLLYFATHAEFEQNNVSSGFLPEGVGAFAEAARNRMVLPIDLTDEKLQALIQHELTHVFEYELLYGGRLSRVLSSSAPTWFMEGLASYFGNDEDDKDRMFIRDAVNSDQIPPITRVQIEGYPAYRYGHAVFDFIEAEWGRDAVRDFVYEFRSFLGREVTVALRRAFEIEPDEFDLRFRRYLRRKYLPLLAVKGEVSEYGERFRVAGPDRFSYEFGAAPSPSGDFIATLTSYKEDVDVALLSTKSRRLFANLSSGRTTKYEYLTAQYMTTGPDTGRDLAFAPDGDRIAVFGRRERGRQLFLYSARGGGIVDRVPVGPDVPLSPSFTPDGKSVVFAGTENGDRDIFLLDLGDRTTRNLTDDAAYDGGPVVSPDGKYVYHSKVVSGFSKIVRFPLTDPTKVEQVTWGDGNDEDPALSLDGKRLYFASSRGGIYNVYGQDLGSGDIVQYTDVIGAAIGPAPLTGPDGQEKVVFSGYQAGRFQLYLADAKKPVKKLDEKALPPAPLPPNAAAPFVPAVEVAVDPEKNSRPKFTLFLNNATGYVGVNTDQTFISLVQLDFSDLLGDRRAFVVFDSVSTFANFRLGFYNLKHRLQWGVQAYDQRTYFTSVDTNVGTEVRDRRFSKETGISLEAAYPFTRYTRIEGSIGFVSRTLDVAYAITNADGSQAAIFQNRKDNVPTASVGFSHDTSYYKSFGPHGGTRFDVYYRWLPDFKEGGSISSDVVAEVRKYLPITRRTLLAFRAFGGVSTGNAPTVFYFGGLDTLRGYDFRTKIGNRAFYANTEFRFPLIDVLSTPLLAFGGVRGRIFLDVGGAWLKDEHFQFWDGANGRLKDGLSSYGAGFSVYFLGLPWNFDFARQWDFRRNVSDWQSTFYIGTTF